MRPGDRAWLWLGVAIVAWEWSAPEEELLSEAADRAMLRHPWLVRGVAFTLAAHVCNSLPPRVDPIHRLFALRR